MTTTISVTQDATLAALRSWLLSVLPDGTEVVAGQSNRVPEPRITDFVVMIPLLRERIETNITKYEDPYPSTPSTRSVLQPTKLTVQLDVHGPNGGDNVQIVTTLFRDLNACEAFAASGIDVSPLYTSEPRQLPFINAEQQYEDRHTVDVVMQVNPIVTQSQDFADALHVGIINVDVVYPPS